MTTTTRRYRQRGVTAADILAHTPATSVTTTPTFPPCFQEVTADDSFNTDIDAYMAEQGADFVEADPPANTSFMIANIKSAKLAADSTAFPVASGWQDVSGLSVSLSTLGGTTLGITLSAVNSNIAIGGQVQAIINGGSFSNVVVGLAAFPLLTSSFAGFTTFVTLPAAARTTYTVRVQARGLGVLASVTLAAGATSIAVFEYAG